MGLPACPTRWSSRYDQCVPYWRIRHVVRRGEWMRRTVLHMSTTAHREDLALLSDAALLMQCRKELARPPMGDAGDDGPALELVRRAVVERQEAAWAGIQQIFGCRLIGWCRRSGADEDVLDALMQLSWVKFWHNYTPAKFGVATELAQVLQYLKLCARSAVFDAARHRRETTRLDPDRSVADPRPSPDEALCAAVEGAALWRLVEGHLHDERERVLLQLTYGLGLKAAAVHARRPDLFATVQEVYRVTHNVLDRLRRSHVLQE